MSWMSFAAVLAAWFRLKYPHVAIGALASSAPILNFEDVVSPYSFNNIITHDFEVSFSLPLPPKVFKTVSVGCQFIAVKT